MAEEIENYKRLIGRGRWSILWAAETHCIVWWGQSLAFQTVGNTQGLAQDVRAYRRAALILLNLRDSGQAIQFVEGNPIGIEAWGNQ
jgi:hypothetical protein